MERRVLIVKAFNQSRFWVNAIGYSLIIYFSWFCSSLLLNSKNALQWKFLTNAVIRLGVFSEFESKMLEV